MHMVQFYKQARSWPGGPGSGPPELSRVTFLNRVNPETFCGGRGWGGGGG